MRLASFNVENLFDRAKAMNLDSWADGKPVLEKFAALNGLLGQVTYSAADKTRMAALIVELGMEKSDTGPFVILRRNRGALLKRPHAGGVIVTANGRSDWVGSLELRDAPVSEQAMRNTARVMTDLEADVLGVVEVVRVAHGSTSICSVWPTVRPRSLSSTSSDTGRNVVARKNIVVVVP